MINKCIIPEHVNLPLAMALKRIPTEKTALKNVFTLLSILMNHHHMGIIFSYTGKKKQGFYGSEGAKKKFQQSFIRDRSWQKVMDADVRKGFKFKKFIII